MDEVDDKFERTIETSTDNYDRNENDEIMDQERDDQR